MYPSQPSRMIVLVATPTDERAKALAEALFPLGWDVIISADVTPYLQYTRVFAAMLSPATVQSLPLFTRPQALPVGLIPILVEPMELPLANWVSAPIQYNPTAVATTAQALALTAMSIPAPLAAVPMAPSTPYFGSGYSSRFPHRHMGPRPAPQHQCRRGPSSPSLAPFSV